MAEFETDGDRGQELTEGDEPSEATLAEAREMHWVPKEEFRGNPDDWVPAAEFVERGRSILPIVRATNLRMREELRTESAARLDLERRLRLSEAALSEIQTERVDDAKADVDAAKANLEAKIEQAARDQDFAAVAKLTRRLVEVAATPVAAPVAAVAPANGGNGSAAADPHYTAWVGEHPEFNTDPEYHYQVLAIGATLNKRGLKGQAFYNELNNQLDRRARGAGGRQIDRTEGGGPSNGGRSESSDSGYDALPADAKAECNKQASNPKLVGANRVYKTVADYRKYYATEYFRT